MKSDFEFTRDTLVDLLKNEQHRIAFPVLDYYFSRAKKIQDFELIGLLCLKYVYPELAVKAAERVHSLSQSSEELYIARSNLYKAYHAANEPEKALFYTRLNLEKTPDDFETLLSYSEYLKSNGQRSDSEKVLDELEKRDDLNQEQVKSLILARTYQTLKSGNTAEGVRRFIYTEKDKTTTFDLMGMKRWNGVPLPGSKLYVNSEGGYGDIFINIRFFEHLRRLGMRPILYSNLERHDLDAVLIRNGYEVITHDPLIEKNRPWTYLMHLPVDLNVAEKDLWFGPYIKPKNITKKKDDKFKIGIKCNGNQYFARDSYRSIPIDDMLSIMPQNVEVYYIDIDKTDERVINLKDRIKTWDDTLNVISEMDLIVSSCTSIVHAAGAMGVPTIVISPILEYYPWTSTRTDTSTPWYGENFHVLRQKKPRCWKEPLKECETIINRIVNERYRMETL